ncbi:hypothetical protein N9459_03775 [Flavobacteriaceae bacterium]|nr:hypothetical protein [Flavobacteriaceae bacterium]
MPVLTPGTTFANGEQLTASDLNLLVQGATFTQSSVDNQSTQLVGTAIVVADGGIIAAKLDADAVTTSKIKDANVTFAKLTDVIDDDTMATATDTTLATSESIKAYVDATVGGFTPSTYAGEESVTLPNGLIMKTGIITSGFPGNGVLGTISFAVAFPGGCVNATYMLNNIATTGESNSTIESVSAANFTYKYGKAIAPTKLFWQAIGY